MMTRPALIGSSTPGMAVIPPEEFVPILVRTLKYFLSADDLEESDDVKWVDNTINSLENGLNPYERERLAQPNPVLKLLNLLRESLLTQRWEEVLKLITFISLNKDVKLSSQIPIFKVGLELSYHLEPCRGRYLEQLMHQLIGPTAISPWHVTLEYIFFLLSSTIDSPDIEGAMRVFQTFKKPSLSKLSDGDQEKTVFEAYKGMLHYTQWLTSKHKVDAFKAHTGEVNMIEEVEIGLDEKNMDILCDRALTSFQSLRDNPGVWDIFITKYAQLLEWCDMLDDAEAVLVEYQQVNPNNPNAHKYLINHYKKHGNTHQIIPVLQKLCDLLPSDDAVLELVYYHRTNGASPSVTMPLLFTLLDYPCWQALSETWCLLAQCLLNSLESEVDEKIGQCLQECWPCRLMWWPKYHFNKVKVTEELQVITNKAVVALIFGVGESYVGEVKHLISGDETLLNLLERATEAANQLQVESEETRGTAKR